MDFVGVFLEKKGGEALYIQLYTYLAEAIRSGGLAEGERLPGKRSAAAQLGVSVNTVDAAYGMLAAEGYVEARPRSGFVVSRVGVQVPPPAGTQAAPVEHSAEKATRWRYNFSSGGIDPSLFPRKVWNRLFREVLAGGEELFTQGPPQGEEVLREAIAGYLRGFRGVRCDADQIQIGAGLELLTGQLARMFPDKAVAVENPGYTKSARVLRNEGLAVCPVAIDGEGMRPDRLAQSGAALAYLTPSHQFPTGVVMPVGRRTELLHWAGEGGLIIEDDYDSEFRFESRPLPSLQGLDGVGRVVYAGTFSRSLSPGLRVAYLVLPRWLVPRWKQMYGDYACTVSRPEQHTLARFISGGHFSRSVNRARAAYRKKRDAVVAGVKQSLPRDKYTFRGRHTGLYFLLELKGGDETGLAARCREAGLRVHSVGEYYAVGAPPPEGARDALVLGYGGLDLGEILAAVAALCEIVGDA